MNAIFIIKNPRDQQGARVTGHVLGELDILPFVTSPTTTGEFSIKVR